MQNHFNLVTVAYSTLQIHGASLNEITTWSVVSVCHVRLLPASQSFCT